MGLRGRRRLAIAIGLRIPDEDHLGRVFQRLLGLACLLLPVLRLATGGMSWADALMYRQFDVPSVDLLLLIAGASLGLRGQGPVRHASCRVGACRVSVAAALAATGLSLAGLGWLSATDPKRRRAFGLPALTTERPARAVWALVPLPGMLVPFWSGAAGFVIWLGATSVLGWVLVAVPPGWIAARIHAPRRFGASVGNLGPPRGWRFIRASSEAPGPRGRRAVGR